MKKLYLPTIITAFIFFVFTMGNLKAQCNYIAATSSAIDTLSYNFSGGFFASFGCAPIDPTYWMAGSGGSITVNFVSPQSYPTFRVWGMNDDDSASVTVNGASYPLTSASASYDTKVVCGLSPGPDGIIFSGGKFVGANSNTLGNYSYQNVQLNATNVSTFTVIGISGAGWGFAGTSVNCPLNAAGTVEIVSNHLISIYPNPSQGEIKIISTNSIDELTVTDLLGRVIYTSKPNEKKVSLHINNSGIYFLTVTSNKQTSTSKLNINK